MKTTISRPAPTRKRTLRVIAAAGAAAATLLLGTVAAAATTGSQDQADQGTAPLQSEQERTQARHRALGAQDTPAAPAAASEQQRTQARHRALGALDTPAAPAA